MQKILLISNSTNYGCGFLDHCEDEIVRILGGARHILFVPYALRDWDRYAELVDERFGRMGLATHSIHTARKPSHAVKEAEAIFVGGGNTFRLLERLARAKLLQGIRESVRRGSVYMGASAGANVACPTIKTTNDMPIVQPRSFKAMALVPFNVNPHYCARDPESTHMGEDRDTRILEFHEENKEIVVGLREGGMLRIEEESVALVGEGGARVFQKDETPVDYEVGSRLDFLFKAGGCRTDTAGGPASR